MIVTYTPDTGTKRTWEYRAADLRSSEAEDIEDVTGVTFDVWQQRLLEGGMRARRALLWVLLRRETPGLKFADVAFRVGEVEVEFDADELRRLRAELEKATEISDADRAEALRLLDEAAAEAGQGEGEGPKGSTTPGPSAPGG